MHRHLPHPIGAARTAQQHAVRAIAVRGLAHPVTRALLAAAALAAAMAWEAGHRVTDTHPPLCGDRTTRA
ncbi:hypothetical protein [Streptomyces chryseus]|uniref:hypothetical protein n=1 Tax=Streptomyces chryseus TaxID=68186 RepID=UPI00110FE243|nr:hypothetical protein [Streptomyces chryseus]